MVKVSNTSLSLAHVSHFFRKRVRGQREDGHILQFFHASSTHSRQLCPCLWAARRPFSTFSTHFRQVSAPGCHFGQLQGSALATWMRFWRHFGTWMPLPKDVRKRCRFCKLLDFPVFFSFGPPFRLGPLPHMFFSEAPQALSDTAKSSLTFPVHGYMCG